MIAWQAAGLRTYGRDDLIGDLIAGVIVAIMLLPQSMAYALLAGLPPEVGLYASLVPLILYDLVYILFRYLSGAATNPTIAPIISKQPQIKGI